MDAETTDKLDQIEQEFINTLEYRIKSGWYNDAVHCSQALVNIAMYRRLVVGDKMRLRSDGTVSL